RQLRWLCMIVWALNTASTSAESGCPALLPTCVIAGQGIRAPSATEQAPGIGVGRLRIADLRFAQQRSGNDKKHKDRHAGHGLSPCRLYLFLILSVFLKGRNKRLAGTPESAHHRCGVGSVGSSPTVMQGSGVGFPGKILMVLGSQCLLATLKTCPP